MGILRRHRLLQCRRRARVNRCVSLLRRTVLTLLLPHRLLELHRPCRVLWVPLLVVCREGSPTLQDVSL